MILSKKLLAGERVVTAEITPPKGPGIKKMLQHAEALGPFVDAINITDCQRALVKMSSLAACRVLLDHGYEPVFQLTCRDRNSIALQADMMGAGALGIPNLLCLTGDPVKAGDSPHSKSVFEIESVGLLNLAGKLQQREDGTGRKTNKATRLFLGAVVNPTLRSRGQLVRMQKKIAAGASFFQTQANYDLDDFFGFLQEARLQKTKILAGVLILTSYQVAAYIDREIPGIQIPKPVLARFEQSKDPLQTGIDLAVETMLKVEPVCEGFHMMSIRAEALIPKVLQAYDERKRVQSTEKNAITPLPSAAKG